MAVPWALSRPDVGTPVVVAAFANVRTQLLARVTTRLGAIIRNKIANTQILYIMFSDPGVGTPVTDANCDEALNPGDVLIIEPGDTCGVVFASFSGAVAESCKITAFT